jgi:hypothetical protein
MENRAKRSLGFLGETIVKKFLLAMLTIAALSGAVVVTHSSPAAAWRACPDTWHECWE